MTRETFASTPVPPVVIQDIPLVLKEKVIIEIYRGHRGYYLPWPDEVPVVRDLVVNDGRIWLARRINGGDSQSPIAGSAMAYMAVGTVATAPALTNSIVAGEIKRKLLATNTALASSNVYTAIATFGGFAETIQSIAITEAAILNHASSGLGLMFQRVTFAAVTLADSDLVNFRLETNVGSNTI